ncbi:hypothetical protein [Gelidibacter salicanalis]|nr:hypothetical protein [Gelidibacter salicanalis]
MLLVENTKSGVGQIDEVMNAVGEKHQQRRKKIKNLQAPLKH